MTESERVARCGCRTGMSQPCNVCRRFGKTDAPPPTVECRFRGDDLTGHERKALGLSSARWAPCSHPDQPKGKYVCPCSGCKPGCPGYIARSPDDGV